jgi:hypothetical protein
MGHQSCGQTRTSGVHSRTLLSVGILKNSSENKEFSNNVVFTMSPKWLVNQKSVRGSRPSGLSVRNQFAEAAHVVCQAEISSQKPPKWFAKQKSVRRSFPSGLSSKIRVEGVAKWFGRLGFLGFDGFLRFFGDGKGFGCECLGGLARARRSPLVLICKRVPTYI